ncbi:diguanylate cyclase [Cereibacter sphaeroides]|uniref:diguanylate cyclase n=1 Tax=Rhodobacterales TaxID=204455 RepID=UPI000BBEF18C|nr:MULTISPECIES: diguanylate cyclase [Paracoccaceae]MCE6951044.1 diguanylate cyclase [Cereibacter sphaeroides]
MGGTVLIADNVATNRIVLKVKLGAACYRPLLAADAATCLAVARAEAPDLILLDLMLPDMSGIEVLRRLRADPLTREIPVVMISASRDAAVRLEALSAGADDYLAKPVDDLVLMARLRSLLRLRDATGEVAIRGAALRALGLAEEPEEFEGPACIALVAARPEVAIRWRKDLQALMPDRLLVQSREEALADTGAPPDLFIIDADLEGPGGGLRLMSELRSRAGTRHAAVCIVRSEVQGEGAAMAYDLGANDLLPAGFDPREARIRLRNVLRRKRRADRQRATLQNGLRLAVVDPLTGLYNRRYAGAHLAAVAERAQTLGERFAVMVIDLDRFKAVNDRWGHGAGDAVLVEVARRLHANLRPGDLLARIGGEEFLVALPDIRWQDEARAVAERIREAVEELPVQLPGGGSLQVTVSIGLAFSSDGDSRRLEPVADVINRADSALLVAKSGGRNQVTIGRTAAA